MCKREIDAKEATLKARDKGKLKECEKDEKERKMNFEKLVHKSFLRC